MMTRIMTKMKMTRITTAMKGGITQDTTELTMTKKQEKTKKEEQ